MQNSNADVAYGDWIKFTEDVGAVTVRRCGVVTFALCPIVTMEKIADHPAAGHMWLMELANGRTQVGFGYEIKVRAT